MNNKWHHFQIKYDSSDLPCLWIVKICICSHPKRHEISLLELPWESSGPQDPSGNGTLAAVCVNAPLPPMLGLPSHSSFKFPHRHRNCQLFPIREIILGYVFLSSAKSLPHPCNLCCICQQQTAKNILSMTKMLQAEKWLGREGNWLFHRILERRRILESLILPLYQPFTLE